jgi:hypothetical protein
VKAMTRRRRGFRIYQLFNRELFNRRNARDRASCQASKSAELLSSHFTAQRGSLSCRGCVRSSVDRRRPTRRLRYLCGPREAPTAPAAHDRRHGSRNALASGSVVGGEHMTSANCVAIRGKPPQDASADFCRSHPRIKQRGGDSEGFIERDEFQAGSSGEGGEVRLGPYSRRRLAASCEGP